jgi:hypothetical protein
MNRRLLLACALGVLVGAAFSLGFSPVFYAFYLAIGSPDRPTPLLNVALVVISFLIGVLGALVASAVVHAPRANVAFVVSAVALILGVAATFVGVSGVVAQLSSEGFWAFVVGMLFVLGAASRLRGATQPIAPADGSRLQRELPSQAPPARRG